MNTTFFSSRISGKRLCFALNWDDLLLAAVSGYDLSTRGHGGSYGGCCAAGVPARRASRGADQVECEMAGERRALAALRGPPRGRGLPGLAGWSNKANTITCLNAASSVGHRVISCKYSRFLPGAIRKISYDSRGHSTKKRL